MDGEDHREYLRSSVGGSSRQERELASERSRQELFNRAGHKLSNRSRQDFSIRVVEGSPEESYLVGDSVKIHLQE